MLSFTVVEWIRPLFTSLPISNAETLCLCVFLGNAHAEIMLRRHGDILNKGRAIPIWGILSLVIVDWWPCLGDFVIDRWTSLLVRAIVTAARLLGQGGQRPTSNNMRQYGFASYFLVSTAKFSSELEFSWELDPSRQHAGQLNSISPTPRLLLWIYVTASREDWIASVPLFSPLR